MPVVKNQLPLHYVTAGMAFKVVAEFPDTAEGERAANATMKGRPDLGVLAVDQGRVILASSLERGVKVERVQVRDCTCCGGAARGRQWHNQDTGYGLCVDCIDYCGRSFTWPEEFERIYGKRGIHYDVQA